MTDNSLAKVEFREKVTATEAGMKAAIAAGNLYDAEPDCPVSHHFTPLSDKYGCAVYGREIFLKAGTMVIGKLHRHAHLNVISAGAVLVNTEFGAKKYSAPCTFISEPGLKRAVVAIADTVWTTVHLTDSPGEENLDIIEDEVISPTYEEMGLLDNTKLLRGES